MAGMVTLARSSISPASPTTTNVHPIVPEGCDNGMAGWGARRSGFFLHPGEVMEVWVFDLDSQMVVVEALWFTEAPAEELTELRAVIDTLVLTP